jgi:hypothetical protein
MRFLTPSSRSSSPPPPPPRSSARPRPRPGSPGTGRAARSSRSSVATRPPLSCSDPRSGASLLEAAVAVAVLAVLLAASAGALSGSARSLGRARASAREAAALLGVDDAVRSAVAELRVPYWRDAPRLEAEGAAGAVAVLGGPAEDTLRIGPSPEGLFVERAGARRLFPGVEFGGASLVEGGAAVGLELRYRVGGRGYSTLAVFGSRPLGREAGL